MSKNAAVKALMEKNTEKEEILTKKALIFVFDCDIMTISILMRNISTGYSEAFYEEKKGGCGLRYQIRLGI